MTREPSAEAMMPGQCVICGLSNYPLSMGGPTICPSCDCGDFGPMKVERQRTEIERLTNAIRRIDGINDNPACYSPLINAVCDAILRPHLKVQSVRNDA